MGLYAGLFPSLAAAAPPRVAIIPVVKVEHEAGAASEIRQSAVGAVRTVGGIAVLQDKMTPAQLACTTPECVADVATHADASHVLRVDAHLMRKGFKLHIELWGASGMIDRKVNECDRCSLIDLQKAIREATTALLTPVLPPLQDEEASTPAPTPALPPPALAAEPTPPASPAPQAPPAPVATLPVAPTPPPPDAESPSWPWMGEVGGVALGAAGLTSLAIGSYYLSVNGDCSVSDCTYKRHTSGSGAAWMAVGVGTLAAGAILFIYSYRSGKASTSTKTALRPTLGGWELAF